MTPVDPAQNFDVIYCVQLSNLKAQWYFDDSLHRSVNFVTFGTYRFNCFWALCHDFSTLEESVDKFATITFASLTHCAVIYAK
jgi:hypothetical protein